MEVQDKKVVLKLIPDKTNKEEIKQLIKDILPIAQIREISIMDPGKKSIYAAVKTLMAFVELDSNETRDQFLAQFNVSVDRPKGRTYLFTNGLGISSSICAFFTYEKRQTQTLPANENWETESNKTDEKPLINLGTEITQSGRLPVSSKRSTNDLELVCDLDDAEIDKLKAAGEHQRQWDHDKKDILAKITRLEEQMRTRCPNLFVSELEVKEVREEEQRLQLDIRRMQGKLDKASSQLIQVKERIDCLND